MKALRTGLLALLCAAVSAATLYLCFFGLRAQPLLLSDPGDPGETTAAFFDALCSGDTGTALSLCDGWAFSDELPEDEDAAAVYAQLLSHRSWEALGPAVRDGIRAAQDVRFTYLDLDALTAGLREDVNARLAAYVDEAQTAAEIYDEAGSYRESVVQRAWEEALGARLARAEDCLATAELTVELSYQNEQWLLEYSEALMRALSGGV